MERLKRDLKWYRVRGKKGSEQDLKNSLWWLRYGKHFGRITNKIADERLKERFGISIDEFNENYEFATANITFLPLWIFVKAADVQEAMEKLKRDAEVIRFVYGLSVPEDLTEASLLEWKRD